MPVSNALNCFFIHIPKTGGQTVKRLLQLEDVVCRDDQEPGHLTCREIFKQYPEYRDCFKFSIVRNPLDRMVSEYFFSKSYRPYLLGTEDISFDKYIELISRIDVRSGPHRMMNHLYPQVKFLYDGGTMLVDKIGRFERFEESILEILSMIGIEARFLWHENRTQHACFMDYYGDRTERIVRDLYGIDFEVFGY